VSDELHQIEQVLTLASADDQVSAAEKIDLLTSTCDRLLAACRAERERADQALFRSSELEATATALRQAAAAYLALMQSKPHNSTELAAHYRLKSGLMAHAGSALLAELEAARTLDAAVEAYHAAELAAATDPAWPTELAAATARLSQARAAYRAAQRGGE